MKRLLTTMILALLLLVACGGNSEPAANAPADDAPAGEEAAGEEAAAEEDAAPAEDDAADAVADEDAAAEADAATEEEAAAEADAETADEPAVEEESADAVEDSNPAGLPVNPDPVVPGEPFIVEGTVLNATMIPADAPQFLIEGDNGVRYRMNSQPAGEILTTTGEQLLPHQYGPGLRVRATVLLPADAALTDVAVTEDLTIIIEE